MTQCLKSPTGRHKIVEVDSDEIFIFTQTPQPKRVCLFCNATATTVVGVPDNQIAPSTLPRDSIAMRRQEQPHHVHTVKE